MKKPRRVSALVGAGALLLVAALGGWLYSRNASFRISEVDVQCEDEPLAKVVQGRLIGLLGRSLVSISLSSIENELKALPEVEEVLLRRRWPGTLAVEVHPRLPVALAFIKGELWGVDREGRPIAPLRHPVDRPLLKNFFSDGGHFRGEDESFSDFLEWLLAAERHDAGQGFDLSKFNEIVFDPERGFVARSFELEMEVELGFRDITRAWLQAGATYQYLLARGIKVASLDATYRRRVIARPRSAAAKLQIPPNGLNL